MSDQVLPSSRRALELPTIPPEEVKSEILLEKKPYKTEKLTLRSTRAQNTSYAMHAQHIVNDFRSFGVDVKWRAWHEEEVDDRELLLGPPGLTSPCSHYAHFTMNESSQLSDTQAARLEDAKLVLVPGSFNQVSFAANHDVQAYSVGLGIDPEVFKPSPMLMNTPCVFMTGGSTSHAGVRKNFPGVVDAFRSAFPKQTDVALRIKCSPGEVVDTMGDTRILVKAAWVGVEALAGHHVFSTAYVDGSFGEGWGLFLHEAAACARPSITTLTSGMTEFLDAKCSFRVEAKPVYTMKDYYSGAMMQPIKESMVEQMRLVYKDRELARHKGLLAAEKAHSFTWSRVNLRLYKILKAQGFITT